MKLANVVFCRTKDFNNEWAVSNDQYDNEIIENVSTSQKIKIGRYLTASLEKVSETYNSDDSANIYNFSDDGHYVINKKNLSITMIKNSKKDTVDYSHQHLLYLTIPTSVYKVIDSNINLQCAEVINTYRGNNMMGGIIQINDLAFPDPAVSTISTVDSNDTSSYVEFTKNEVVIGEFILYNESNNTVLTKKRIIVNRDLSNVYVTTEIVSIDAYKEIASKVMSSNYFKKLLISPSTTPRTTVYVVNANKFNEVEELLKPSDIAIIGVDNNVIKDFEKGKIDKELEQVMMSHVMNAKVRAITVVGIKLPKEFYRRYKIHTCFMHDINTGIIKCIKAQ